MLDPIGTIHSPFQNMENMPIQPKGAMDVEGTVHLQDRFIEGLQDLDGFSHIYLIYSFSEK